MDGKPQGIEIFFCYAREDQKICQELKKHLMPLQYNRSVILWADTDIQAGAEWEKEIHHHLSTAQIILLLISPDFMNSSYCYDVEVQRTLERHERGEARVIPIILRPVDWQNTPFGKLQALPTGARPITSRKWRRDEAFLDIAFGIRHVVEELEGNAPARLPVSNVAHSREELQQPRNSFSPANLQKRFWFSLLLVGLLIGVIGGASLLRGAANTNPPGSPVSPLPGSPISSGSMVSPTPTTNPAQAMGYYLQYTKTQPTQEYTPADTSQWFNGTPAYGICSKEDGYHVLPNVRSFAACIASLPVLTGDYAVQAAIIMVAGTGAGLAFGFSSQNSPYNGNYYLWSFCRIDGCPAQNVLLYYGLTGGGSECLGPDPGPDFSSASQYCNATSSAVKTALGQVNVLTAIVLQKEIYLYVNATFITAIYPTFPTDGQVGIGAMAGSCKACQGQTDVSFQDLKIWRIQS